MFALVKTVKKVSFPGGGKKEILCQSVGLLVTNLNEHHIFYILVTYKPQEIKLHLINVPFFHVTLTFISGIFNLIRDIIS